MSKRVAKRRPVAEDFVQDIASVSITLENGTVAELVIADEVHIPTDPEELHEAARRSSAKLAFWHYQTERALDDVRRTEQQLAQSEGRHYDLYRVFFTDEQGVTPTEPMIRAKVDQDREVRRWRIALHKRRREYGILRSVRDAVDRRDSMLRAFTTKYEP